MAEVKMDDQATPVIYDSQVESFTILQTWIMALTQPYENTYARLIRDPKAGFGKAVLWVFVTNLIGYSILSLANLALGGLSVLSRFSELKEFMPDYPYLLGGSMLASLLCIPVWTVVGLVIFLVHTSIVHFVAGALGGNGTYSELVYAFAAFTAPFALIYDILMTIPIIQCFAIFTAFYAMFLSIVALKTVHRFSWGKSIGTFVILLILWFFIIVIIGLLLMRFLSGWLSSQMGI